MLCLQNLATSILNGPMLKNSLIFLGLLTTPLFSSCITLVNDSAFALSAEIFNAAGDHIASIKLSQNQMYIWNDSQSPFIKQNDSTITPFTITFVCANARPYDYSPPPKKGSKTKRAAYQTEFGSWTGVPTGATVNALGVNGGTRSCVIKKGAKKGAPPVKKPGPKNQKNEGFNNWSNDGGQTWTNDGGSGWEDSDFSEDFD